MIKFLTAVVAFDSVNDESRPDTEMTTFPENFGDASGLTGDDFKCDEKACKLNPSKHLAAPSYAYW